MGRPNAERREAGRHRPARALAPPHGLPLPRGQSRRERSGGDRLVTGVATPACRRPPAPHPRAYRQRRCSRRPDARVAFDPNGIRQAAVGQGIAKLRRVPVPGIGLDRRGRQIIPQQRLDLCNRDLPFLQELDLAGHPGGAPALGVRGPRIGQDSCHAAGTLMVLLASETVTAT